MTAEPRHFLDVLHAHARRLTDRDAVLFLADGRCVGARLSFAALQQEALQLAAGLHQRHPAPARILLMLPAGLDYVCAFFGCLYAGLAAVPLFPPTSRKPHHLSRIARVVADAAPAAVLCEAPAREILQALLAENGLKADVLTVESLKHAGSLTGSPPEPGGDTLAYLQYTSGSTGTPKGVMVQHRHLLANCRLMQRAYGFSPRDRLVSWLPLYHDMGLIGGLLAPLYAGMPCYLMASQTFVGTPSAWLEALSRYQASASFAPNFAYALCNRTVDDALIARLDLSHWRHAINGAEPIHPATLREFCRRFAPAGFRPKAFSPGYGQAEATLCVTATPAAQPPLLVDVDTRALAAGNVRISRSGAGATVLVGCGYPQPNHEVAVVHPETGRRCAADEVGELWLRGPSNAAGYWRNEAATAATFRARLADTGEAYLRSGDLGFLYQGQVVICGRLKDLIILNGRNVYPQDVESAIGDAEPAIRAGRLAAFAIADPELGREELVVAAEPRRRYLDPVHHPRLFARMRQAVRDALDCSLDRIVLVRPGTIPMTTSGKISRQGARQQWLANTLAVVGTTAGAEATAVILDAAAVRERIAAGEPPADAWLAYLRGQLGRLAPGVAVEPEDSLIASGLDSVALLALHGILQSELGWQGGLGVLFEDRSLKALAAMVAQAPRKAAPSLPASAPRSEIRQSFAQRRLWFLHRLAPDSGRHNVVVTLSLEGAVDAAALDQALDHLCRRHAILRTAYADRPDGPVQVVLPEHSFSLRRHELEAMPPETQRQYRERLVEGERRIAFALARGDVFHGHLLHYRPDFHDLVLTFHHIAFDGRSAEILLEELSGGYAAGRRGARPTLPDLPLHYADFAEWEAARLDSARIDQALAFWRAYLDAIPQILHLPHEPEGTAAPHRFHVDRATCAALARLSQSLGQTLFTTLLTLFGVLLHYLGRQDRFLVGTDVTGRLHPQWEQVIGFFVNQLPLRCDLAGEPTLAELFARLRRDARDAYAHQELPFDLLVSALAPERSTRQAPLFQVKLNYQRDGSQRLQLDGVHLAEVHVEQDPAGFDLVLDLVHGSQGIAACLEYDPARFGALQMRRFAALWKRLLIEAERLLPLSLGRIHARLEDWDGTLQQEQQRPCDEGDIMTTQTPARPPAGAMRRKAVTVSEPTLVSERLPDAHNTLPLVIEPKGAGIDLIEWAARHREALEQKLLRHGALLFRGFGIRTVEQFEQVVTALSGGALEYMFRASPRTRVHGNIYTSTDYPADQAIFPHNEHSYSPRFPLRLFFYCHLPAETGGETPIGCVRRITRRLRPELRERFRERQVLYVRNYGDGFGLPWQTVFQTEDKTEVEAYCASVGIDCEWKPGDRLRTRQQGPALVRHPRSGEALWFNHATFFHVSTLPPAIRDPLLASFGPYDLPTNTFYGDGTRIEPEVLQELRALYLESLVRFAWRQGDVLFIDNMLSVHARDPFSGRRAILTGMAEAVYAKDVAI